MPSLHRDTCRRHNILCLLCKANTFSERTEGTSTQFVPRRLQQSSTYDLKTWEAHSTDEAERSSSTARPRTITTRPLQWVSNLDTPKSEGSTAQLRDDGSWVAKCSGVKDVHEKGCEVWDHIVTTQTQIDPTYNRAKAERDSLGPLQHHKRRRNRDSPNMLRRNILTLGTHHAKF